MLLRWLERWWSRKYKLPPNDARFTSRSYASLYKEMLEDYAQQREDLIEQIRSGGGQDRARLFEALTAIEKLLGYRAANDTLSASGDVLVDEWDRAMEEGGPLPASLTRGLVKPKRKRQNAPKTLGDASLLRDLTERAERIRDKER